VSERGEGLHCRELISLTALIAVSDGSVQALCEEKFVLCSIRQKQEHRSK